MNKSGIRLVVVLVAGLVLVNPACRLLRREPTVLIRPGCRIRIVDDRTGHPLANVRVSVFALWEGIDTAGSWSYTSSSTGEVVITSARRPARVEEMSGRRGGSYEFLASFEAESYCYYSQRIGPGELIIRLSKSYMLAYTP